MRNRLHRLGRSDHGFSVTELLVVLGIIGVMSVISLPYIVNFKKAYKSEDQAIRVIDLLREANQMALTRRRAMRFELDFTSNEALLIDGTLSSGRVVRRVKLEQTRDVRMDIIPSTISKPNPPNYTDITASSDTVGHIDGSSSVSGHSVWKAHFNPDGSVSNAAGVPISVNIYSWPPVTSGSTTPRNKNEVRAITIFGGTGAIRYWKHNGTAFVENQ